MNRILAIGDVHGDPDYVRLAIDKAIASKCVQIVQLGDFGYSPHTDEGKAFLNRIKDPEIPIFWIDGNHDNHDWLEHDADEPIEIEKGIYYLPRGYRWMIGDQTLMALGGAESIDKDSRTVGYNYWLNEGLSYSDIERAIAPGCIDILFCHDCPTRAEDFAMNNRSPNPIGKATRDGLDAVIEQCKPRRVLHGHHHYRYSKIFGTTRVSGLDCNERPQFSWQVISF